MRRKLILLACFILPLVALPAGAASTTVEAQDFKFVDSQITIESGDTVTFKNAGEAPHNAVASDGSFKTALLNSGDEEKVVITGSGDIAYKCTIHPDQMKGVITVLAAAAKEPVPTVAASATPTAVKAAAKEEEAEAPPSQKYFPFIMVALFVLMIGLIGLGYLRMMMKSGRNRQP
ncbi:MAG: plastocyanin/azurin family copper-binding protein [Actinomycetota bacterium]